MMLLINTRCHWRAKPLASGTQRNTVDYDYSMQTAREPKLAGCELIFRDTIKGNDFLRT